MYTEVTIELLSDPSVTITEIDMQKDANVSNSLKTLNSYGSNKAFKGFFLMSSIEDKPVATLDGSFKCFGANGYDGAVGKVHTFASDYAYTICTVRFSAIPKSGCTIVLDPSGAPQIEQITVVNASSSSIDITVDPAYPIINIMPGAITSDLIHIKFHMPDFNSNYFTKILYIFTGLTAVYRGTDLIKYECSEHMLDAQLTVTPGICEQYINATIYDRNNVLQQLAAQNKLIANKIIRVYAIDDNLRQQIGEYYSVDWDVRNCESEVGLTGSDGFSYLNNLKYESYSVSDKTVHKMLSDAFSYSNVSWRYFGEYEKLLCTAIVTPTCEYPNTDIISLLEEICRVAMLRIYYYNGTFIVAAAVTP